MTQRIDLPRAFRWAVVAVLLVAAVNGCKRRSEPAALPQTPAVDAGGDTGLQPLPIQLPQAMFVGTPTSMEGVTNLEKPLGKARPPILAPPGVVNVALHKPVTSSCPEPIMGSLEMITDGDKEAVDGSLVELDPFVQSVTIDLEQTCEIYAVLVWHYHRQSRVYFDVIVQVSDDPDFIEAKTIFNNDHDNTAGYGLGTDQNYVETNEGKLIDCVQQPVRGRYVRLISNGNNQNELNHYLEVEVYGRPLP